MASDPQFERGLSALALFVNERGHARVTGSVASAFPLSRWVRYQRERRAAGLLSQDRVEALDALGFIWFAGPTRLTDDDALAGLRLFKEEFGHTDMNEGYRSPQGHVLYGWVRAQRSALRDGSINPLLSAALAELDFDSASPRSHERSLRVGLQEMTVFVQEHGHARVPHLYCAPSGFGLGVWAQHIRQSYRNDSLEKFALDELNLLGMVWWPAESNETFGAMLDEWKSSPTSETQRARVDDWLFAQQMRASTGELNESRRVRLKRAGIYLPALGETFRELDAFDAGALNDFVAVQRS